MGRAATNQTGEGRAFTAPLRDVDITAQGRNENKQENILPSKGILLPHRDLSHFTEKADEQERIEAPECGFRVFDRIAEKTDGAVLNERPMREKKNDRYPRDYKTKDPTLTVWLT